MLERFDLFIIHLISAKVMDENLSTSPTEDGVLVTIDNFDSVESTPVVRPQTPLETPKQVHINTSSQLIDAPI